jgi:hypothetical protein
MMRTPDGRGKLELTRYHAPGNYALAHALT